MNNLLALEWYQLDIEVYSYLGCVYKTAEIPFFSPCFVEVKRSYREKMNEPSPVSPGRPWIPMIPREKNRREWRSPEAERTNCDGVPGGPGGPFKPGLKKADQSERIDANWKTTYAPGNPASPRGPRAPKPPEVPIHQTGVTIWIFCSSSDFTGWAWQTDLTWITFLSWKTLAARNTRSA